MGGTHTPAADSVRAPKAFSETFAAPLVLGGLFTAAVYGAIAVLPGEDGFFRRYFCSHPLEYATTGLFFVAIATLMLKFTRLAAERRELSSEFATVLADPECPLRSAADVQAELTALSPSRQNTWLNRRLADVCSFVRSRGAASGLEDHLRYLGEMASERLHRSYAFVRTITWAVPILGFLGTVIGITLAIANVTPEQLDTSLGDVTSGLAVAFDTTALALALSIVLVFASFIVERSEQQLLVDVEDFSMRCLPGLFGESTEGQAPLLDAQKDAATTLASALDAFVDRQMTLWEDQLGELRNRWNSVLAGQTDGLASSLTDGMSATLENHARQLEDARGLFESSLGQALQLTGDRMTGAVESLEGRLAAWETVMRESSSQAAQQLEALQEQGQLLLRLADEEGQLRRLEETLTSNLEAIRLSETFDQTLNNLTAAVHLLSARSGRRAA